MKKTIFILIIITLNNFMCHSQKYEFSINNEIGMATKNMYIDRNKTLSNLSNIPINKHDLGIDFRFKYEILKKANVFINSGLSISKSKYIFRIINKNGTYFGNIPITKNRLNLKIIGLNKQFNIYNDKLMLDIGISWVRRFYFQKKDVIDIPYYIEKESNSLPYVVKYYYRFETNYNTSFYNTDGISNTKNSLEYYIHLKSKITKNLFFNFGLSYSRNFIFYYNYAFHYKYYINGIDNPPVLSQELGYTDIKDKDRHAVKDHFIYLNFGLSMKFNKITVE